MSIHQAILAVRNSISPTKPSDVDDPSTRVPGFCHDPLPYGCCMENMDTKGHRCNQISIWLQGKNIYQSNLLVSSTFWSRSLRGIHSHPKHLRSYSLGLQPYPQVRWLDPPWHPPQPPNLKRWARGPRDWEAGLRVSSKPRSLRGRPVGAWGDRDRDPRGDRRAGSGPVKMRPRWQ